MNSTIAFKASLRPMWRKITSFHDEPLTGNRQGQRSIRLNRQWRAIYCIHENGNIYIEILEVTPHDYR